MRSVRAVAGADFDILCYSGDRIEHLRRVYPDVLDHIDVLVDGRFRVDLPTLLPWRGSANQRLHRLTPLARQRYAASEIPCARPPLQVTAVFPDRFEIAGIPAPGDLEKINAEMGRAGMRAEKTSW
jgi:anaerobic ribonucleoside-triphosphate reductase activating protein